MKVKKTKYDIPNFKYLTNEELHGAYLATARLLYLLKYKFSMDTKSPLYKFINQECLRYYRYYNKMLKKSGYK